VTETASKSVEQTRTASLPASQPEGQQAPDTQLQASSEPQGQTAVAIVTETAVLHTELVEQTRTASPPASQPEGQQAPDTPLQSTPGTSPDDTSQFVLAHHPRETGSSTSSSPQP
jgi:hypothetical protein